MSSTTHQDHAPREQTPSNADNKADNVVKRLHAEADAYRGEAQDRPVGAFLGTMAAYGAMVSAMGTYVVLKKRPLPNRASWSDLALLALATHKLSRTLAKDTVTSPLRAPFTRYKSAGGPAELMEEVRGEGAQKAVGELISCPFCLDQWVATLGIFGLVAAPRATRLAAGLFGVVAGADMLQFAYAKLQQS